MTGSEATASGSGIVAALKRVIVGENDTRIRALWRVLFAWPLLWFLAGTIGIGVAGAAVAAAAGVLGGGFSQPTTVAVFGVFQALFSGVAIVAWAKWVDRRPFANYGLSLSDGWVLDLVAGFGAVLVGFAVWLGVTSSLGFVTVEVGAAGPAPTVVYGLLALFVGVIVNVWVQETVFVGVILKNGAEGLASRGASATTAVAAALAVAVLLFTLKHRPASATGALNFLIAFAIYGVLYAQTGELALSIGVHAGVNFAGYALVGSGGGRQLLRVTDSLPGLVGTLQDGAIPHLVVAYCLLLAWIQWRRGDVGLETELSRWTGPTADASDEAHAGERAPGADPVDG